MQAHAVRLDDAWVIPAQILFLSPVRSEPGDRRRLERRLYTSSLDFVCSLTKRERNVNMILYLCFSTSQLPTLKCCKNIKCMTKLDDVFVQSDAILLLCLEQQDLLVHLYSLPVYEQISYYPNDTTKKTGTCKE